jgi:hypothetical protein
MKPESEFYKLDNFLRARLRLTKDNPVFAFYFWLAVVGVGGAGIWVSLFPRLLHGNIEPDWSALAASLYTFFPAIAVTSAFELVLHNTELRSLRALGVGIIIFIMSWLILCAVHPMPIVATGLGLIGALFALLLWCVANAENPTFTVTNSTVSSGGEVDPGTPIAGEQGDYQT